MLILDNVSKTFFYADNLLKKKLTILKESSFRFYSNTSYALMGPSGSGKSTLLYLLAGLDRPNSGSIFYNDQNISLFTIKQKENYLLHDIGLAFQEAHLIQELSVLENIMIKALIAGDYDTSLKNYAYHLLEKFNLKSKAYYTPALLSGGEQQRVAIARALLYRPKFLLIDEPTSHLDLYNADLIISFLLDIKKNSDMSLIIATHDLNLAQKLDRQIMFENHTLLQKKLYG